MGTITQMSQADSLQARLIDFGAKITGLAQKLPRSPLAHTILDKCCDPVLPRLQITLKREAPKVVPTSYIKCESYSRS